jgi:hypothetical protein
MPLSAFFEKKNNYVPTFDFSQLLTVPIGKEITTCFF